MAGAAANRRAPASTKGDIRCLMLGTDESYHPPSRIDRWLPLRICPGGLPDTSSIVAAQAEDRGIGPRRRFRERFDRRGRGFGDLTTAAANEWRRAALFGSF